MKNRPPQQSQCKSLKKLWHTIELRRSKGILTIGVTNRHGQRFICGVHEHLDGWYGVDDFGNYKRNISAQVTCFLRSCLRECKEYDNDFYNALGGHTSCSRGDKELYTTENGVTTLHEGYFYYQQLETEKL